MRIQYLLTTRSVCSDRNWIPWDHVVFAIGVEYAAFVGDCDFLSNDRELDHCLGYSKKTVFRLTFTYQGWSRFLCVGATLDRSRYLIRKLLRLHGQLPLAGGIVQRMLAEKYKSLRTTKFEA